jgi:hypothetical protein
VAKKSQSLKDQPLSPQTEETIPEPISQEDQRRSHSMRQESVDMIDDMSYPLFDFNF